MRRRKSPRVVWLPPTNGNSVGDGTTGYQVAVITARPNEGAGQTVDIPMVLDFTFSAVTDPTSSLSDIASTGYRLRRIVGKVFCEVAQAEDNAPNLIAVTAGFIVRRTDTDTGQSLAQNFTGGGDRATSPAIIDNWGDPWIWRRTWLVGNNSANGVIGTANANKPENNYTQYAGGNADGPHVDQKTARIVGPEERLFLTVSAKSIAPATTGAVTTVGIITDIRCLGSLRTSTGNRRNASR